MIGIVQMKAVPGMTSLEADDTCKHRLQRRLPRLARIPPNPTNNSLQWSNIVLRKTNTPVIDNAQSANQPWFEGGTVQRCGEAWREKTEEQPEKCRHKHSMIGRNTRIDRKTCECMSHISIRETARNGSLSDSRAMGWMGWCQRMKDVSIKGKQTVRSWTIDRRRDKAAMKNFSTAVYIAK
jgi:hypothetical protein